MYPISKTLLILLIIIGISSIAIVSLIKISLRLVKEWIEVKKHYCYEKTRLESLNYELAAAEKELNNPELILQRQETFARKVIEQLTWSIKRDIIPELNTLHGHTRNGGYINFSLPSDFQCTFSEIIKDFEDYAKLKGYDILVNVEIDQPDYVSIKFTLVNTGVCIGVLSVKRDILEYIKKVSVGEPFDDMPVRIDNSDHMHYLAILTSKSKLYNNREGFKRNSYHVLTEFSREFEKCNHGIVQNGQNKH